MAFELRSVLDSRVHRLIDIQFITVMNITHTVESQSLNIWLIYFLSLSRWVKAFTLLAMDKKFEIQVICFFFYSIP